MSENKETAAAYALGALGAVQGIWNYCVRPELTASRGWLAVGAVVAVYELACPKGELLSEGVDRAMDRHPLLVPGVIGYTALHLMNALPESLDLFHRGSSLKGRV